MKEAILYSKGENNSVRCHLCRRGCTIREGERGFCHVRENRGGTLYSLVYGKAAAADVDPIEKKPFYHFLPGADCFSFSTVGCNFRCAYCFAPGTIIMDDFAPKPIEQVFEESRLTKNKEVRVPKDRKTLCANGKKEKILKCFRHEYEGELVVIKPFYIPPLESTPNHVFFVWDGKEIIRKSARELRVGEYLVVPKMETKEKEVLHIQLEEFLGGCGGKIRKSRKTGEADLREILAMKSRGCSSREIAERFGMHPVYVRKLMGDLRRDGITSGTFYYPNESVVEDGVFRFKTEKKGIPANLRVNEEFAELLGYYVAEGCAVENANRPNSFSIHFSFGTKEAQLARRTAYLIKKIFGLRATILDTRTTKRVTASSSSLGRLLVNLCGGCAKEKQVPGVLFRSPKKVIMSYLQAYVCGDGSHVSGLISTNTVSKKLAIGTYSLIMLVGALPSFYEWIPQQTKIIEGRRVNQSTLYYVKVNNAMFKGRFSTTRKKFRDLGGFWAVPVHKIGKKKHSGPVYNLEVQKEHSYTANFVGVKNCQNSAISQVQGGSIIGEDWSPERIVQYCKEHNIPGIAYTYTEPTVFMEYALDTAKLAHKEGIFNVFVTNGYMSEEAINEMDGLIDAARIDLKGFNERIYKEVCGGVELEGILSSIKSLHKKMHIEIINLVVPGYNDSKEDLRALSRWCAELDSNVPLHFIGFYPAYKMLDVPRTSLQTLLDACETAMEEGVKFTYSGNLMDEKSESTYCPECRAQIVRRRGFLALENRVKGYNKCPDCGKELYFVNDINEYWKRMKRRK